MSTAPEETIPKELEMKIAAAAKASRRGGAISLIGGLIVVFSLAGAAYTFTSGAHIAASGSAPAGHSEGTATAGLSGKLTDREMDIFLKAISGRELLYLLALSGVEEAGIGVVEQWDDLFPRQTGGGGESTPPYEQYLATILSGIDAPEKLAELGELRDSVAKLRMSVRTVKDLDPPLRYMDHGPASYTTSTDAPQRMSSLATQQALCRAIGAFDTDGEAGD